MNLIHLAAAAIVSIALTHGASASVMTFGNGDIINQSDGYTEAGMILNAGSGGSYRLSNRQASGGYGEREFLFGASQLINFSLVGGGYFDLLSLRVENPYGSGTNWSRYGSFRITGSGGSFLDFSATDFSTLNLIGFSGISSFTLSCATSCQATVDDITFTPAAVPLPASLPLLALGLGVLGIRARRKKI